jgi:O-antigen/teichoic acid export membrane protein
MLNDSSKKAVAVTSEIEKGTATFADNVLTLAGGTTLALGVTILASPITSRLFGPEAYGLASLFRSGAVVLAAITCLRYEMAIVLPKEDEDAAQLFAICGLTLVGMTTLTAILTYFFGARLLLYLNAVELTPVLWLLPITVFLMGLQLPSKFWYTRQKRFGINAAGSALINFPIAVAEIIGGSVGFRAGADLVVIRMFGMFFAPTFFWWRLLKGDLHFIIGKVNPGGILSSAKKYIKFPLFDTGSILLTLLSIQAPIFLLTSFFSPSVCGLYAKAMYMLDLPSFVIGKSVGEVFLQESAAAKAARINLAGLFETVFNRMITIGTLPFATLAIIGPEFFDLYLGTRWTESGVYAQILMPQVFLTFLFGSIETLFGTLGKQKLNLLTNALLLFLRVTILIFGGLMLRDVRLVLFIYMVANVLVFLWRISLLIRATKASARRSINHFLRCVAYVAPSVIPIAVLKWWSGLEAIYLLALIPIFAIPYIAFVLRHDFELRNLFSNYFHRVISFKR